MVGKPFKEFFLFLMNRERGCRLELFVRGYIERNGSVHSVNGKPIRTYVEQFHTEPFQSSRVNAALHIRADCLYIPSKSPCNYANFYCNSGSKGSWQELKCCWFKMNGRCSKLTPQMNHPVWMAYIITKNDRYEGIIYACFPYLKEKPFYA